MIPISIRPSTISSPSAGISFGFRTLSELLQAFAVFVPPERVIHVGIGSEQSEILCWREWPLIEAIVIDAEEEDFQHIESKLNPIIKLYKHRAVLADSVGPTDYFVANNMAENGLVDPTLLRMVWPGLAQSHRYKKDAYTLDHLVADNTLQSWLIVDCLPGVRILYGARDTLKDTTLVCVRALAEAGFRGEPVGSDVNSIDNWLGEQDFKRLAFVAGLNPKVGHAIYGRPTEKPIAPQDLPFIKELHLDVESLRKQLLEATEEKQRIYVGLSKERDTFHVRATELESKLKTSAEMHAFESTQQVQFHTQEKAALSAKLTETQKQVDIQTEAKNKALQQFALVQETVETTQKSLLDVQSALAEVRNSEAEAKKIVETSAAALKQAQANHQSVQVKFDATTKERDIFQARATELEVQLKKTAEKHVAVTTQQTQDHMQAQAALSAKLTEMQKQVEAQKEEKDKALEQFAAAQKSVETTQKSLVDVQSALTKVQQSEAEAKKTVGTSAEALKQSQANQQAVQVKLDATTKERDTFQVRAAELEVQAKITGEKHIASATQQAQAHTQAQAALSVKLTEMQKQVEAQKEAKDKASQQLVEALKAVQTTQKSLAGVQSSLAEVQQSEAEAKKIAEISASATKQAQTNQQAVQAKLDASTKERNTLQARATELEAQLKTAAEKHAAETTQQAQAHTQAQAALSVKLTQMQKQVDEQAQEKDKALEQCSAAQKSLETTLMSLADAEKVATGTKKSLETALEALKDKDDALQVELSRIQSLTAENKELANRQQLMNEELIKAEGQISLIKDLLLREQGI